MSVDWSGNYISDEVCDNIFPGVGKAYNLRSENSKFGIKTAGTWDLFIHNMKITDSENNGFWNNCDAPNATTILEKVTINNCGANGISLKESTVIIRDSVRISNNAGCDFVSVGTNLHMKDVKIESTNSNGCGVRMKGDNIYVEDFSIEAEHGENGHYALWLYGNIEMVNGKIHSKKQGVIFRPLNDNSSAKLCLENVTINTGINGITSIGQNHLFLKDCIINAAGNDVRLIEEEDHTVIVNNTEINPDVGQIEDPHHYCTLLNDRLGLSESNKSILNNYPNPFSNSTIIKYQLPKSINNATLIIYDLSGKELKNYSIEKEGEITFKANSLKSGSYVYTIIANNKTIATRKMIVQ